jgi:hypothetical protein
MVSKCVLCVFWDELETLCIPTRRLEIQSGAARVQCIYSVSSPLPKYNVYTKDLYCPKSDPNTVYIQCFQPSPKYSKYVFPI